MDKTMYEAMEEFNKCIDQVTEFAKKNIGGSVLEMSAEDLAFIQLLFRLVDTSTTLVSKQTEALQGVNDKLDKLLANVKD